MGDMMFRDAKRRIVPQILTENGYSVLSNGDMTGIDIGRYKLLVDKRGDVLPYQYFDTEQMKFVPGTFPGGEGFNELTAQLAESEKGNKASWSVWEEFEMRNFNVKWYAKGDGIVDDTTNIQRLINIVPEGSTIYFPEGNYLLSKRGTTSIGWQSLSRSYCLLIENKKNLKFVFNKNAKLIVPTGSTTTVANALFFKNCENIEIDGANGTSKDPTIKQLYDGSLIVLVGCKNCIVEKTFSFNLMHNTITILSKNITIKDSFAHKNTNSLSGAHFGLYSTDDSTIDNCTCYGGTNDGDIGIFGTCHRDVVSNCRVYNHLYGDATKSILGTDAQGIYVDSGTDNCSVLNSYAYGYYYGIDVKTNAENTLVQGNNIEKCMIAIAGRKGEGGQDMNNIFVKDNIINPNGGNGRANFNVEGITVPIGVWVQNSFGNVIDGNYMGNSTDINKKSDFVGVVVSLVSSTDESIYATTSITNNIFSGENRIGSLWGASTGSFIIVKSGKHINISGNSFDTYLSKTSTEPAIELNNTLDVNITSNQFTKISGGYCIVANNCRNTNITGNNWNQHYGLLKCTGCTSVAFNSNAHLESKAGINTPDILLIDTTIISINNNTKYYAASDYADGCYFEMQGASNYIVCTGNMLDMVNKVDTNWYVLTGDKNVIANNLIK